MPALFHGPGKLVINGIPLPVDNNDLFIVFCVESHALSSAGGFQLDVINIDIPFPAGACGTGQIYTCTEQERFVCDKRHLFSIMIAVI